MWLQSPMGLENYFYVTSFQRYGQFSFARNDIDNKFDLEHDLEM